jgi:hypothetical protein
MRYIYILFSIIVYVLISSCEDSSPINTETDLVVIQAYLFAGDTINDIRITKTFAMGVDTALMPPVNDATVQLVKNTITYNLVSSPGDSGYYNYSGHDLVVGEGDKFTIKVDYFGKVASGTTTVPTPPSGVVESNDTLMMPESFKPGQFQFDSTKNQVKVSWEIEANAMYFVDIRNIEEEPQFVESKYPRRGLPGRMVNMPMNQNSYTILFEDLIYYGRYRVTVYKINQEYVDLYISRNQNSRELNEPLTNIQNGLGIFSAFNSVSVYFRAIQEQ